MTFLMKVLFADDDAGFAEGMLNWLRTRGCEVCWAAELDEAKAKLVGERWDVVLADLHFPDGRMGFELADQLANAGEEAPPMFIFTGKPDLETAMQAVRLPVRGYIPKPPDMERWWATILATVSTSRRGREVARELGELRELLAMFGRDLSAPVALRDAMAAVAKGPGPKDQGAHLFEHTLRDALRVLESTRRHFKSRELGQLRERLELVLKVLKAS
jgi:DNA-binding NtrC family response regulator